MIVSKANSGAELDPTSGIIELYRCLGVISEEDLLRVLEMLYATVCWFKQTKCTEDKLPRWRIT
jgi:hypothetical protein